MQPLRPAELAASFTVSLAVVREALLRLVGEGLVDRLPNRGFAVPAANAQRWRDVVESRLVIEPQALRLAIERGDLRWEASVRASHHALSRTPVMDEVAGRVSDAWADAHHGFHATLLSGCGNTILLETFERLWDSSEVIRRWSGEVEPGRDGAQEHIDLEQACLERNADRAAALLTDHLTRTATALFQDP
jgi:DNA-binding GntR family transcriptional regulator